MKKLLRYIIPVILLFSKAAFGQSCEMTQVNASILPCDGNYFFVSIDITASNTSPGFTLAGNGMIYGTYLYSDLPVVVGPFLGDPELSYEFIAWDVEDPSCQQFTTFAAPDCGPICDFSNPVLDFVACVNNNFALVDFYFEHEGNTSPVFRLFYENGVEVGAWLYSSLPVTITSFAVNGAEPIILTICDDDNADCCETFEFDAIDCNPENCEIYNVSIDPQCTGSNFLVHLDFDYTNVPSDSFTIMGNSLNYGIFGYNELPLTLGPLNGSTNLVWEFNIRDSGDPNCQKVAVLGVYNCPPPCDVLSLEADPVICNGNDAYALQVSMDIEGEGDAGFALFSESTYYGTFQYDDLPVTIDSFMNLGDTIQTISVCDNETLGCCETIAFEPLLCSGCIIYNLNAIPQPCNEENEIYVLLDFDYQNVSIEGFSVSGNQMQYGDFTYDQVPVLIGPFPGDSTQLFEFVVTDLVNGDCFAAIELGIVACGDICELSNLTVETGECTGHNEFVLTLDFDVENAPGFGFDMFINGEFYEYFEYDELPLTLNEFPSSGNGLDTITVCDADNPDCCTSLVFESPECACSIFDATVQFIGCTSDSTFGVELEFFYENLPGDFVDVYFDGVFIGFYSVNDIPLFIPNIPEGDGNGVLGVCANDLNSCCTEVVVELVSCEGSECNIWDLIAEPGDCTSDSTFLLDIDFNYSNLPVDSILVYGNEQLIGQYLVEPLLFQINFPVLGNLTELTVCAVNAPDCCASYTFETPDCDTTDCEIWDLVADPGDCLTDSTYMLLIEYNHENIPGDSVIVSANGNQIGIFINPEGHILIEHFPWFDGDFATITVCAALAPDCCATVEYEIPDCPGTNACSITELAADVGNCVTDSTYNLVVVFQFDNLPVDSVMITANEQNIGIFQIQEGHIVINEFPVFPTEQTNLEVCVVGTPDCCASIDFETPNCEGGSACNIYDLVVNFEGCQSDSTFSVAVNFNTSNLPLDSVIITANEVPIGQFPESNGHIVIEHLPVFPTEHTFITVCALGAPDCCDSYEFITPVCDGSCAIVNLIAEVGDCTSDSTFILDITFTDFNLPGDSVTVFGNEIFVGQFFNSPDLIRIENFPLFDGETTTISVCATGAEDCCDTYTFENPPCAPECDIFEIVVDPGECTSDSTFAAFINFQYQNITTDGFDIYYNGGYLGFFGINDLPIMTNEFPSNTTGQYVVTICESDNLECCESFEFTGPVCEEEICDIFNLEWLITECDSAGNFFFILDFDFENVGGSGFNIVGNDNNYGNFNYENLPIALGPFEPGNTVYEFLVTDAVNSACFEFIEPGMVDCIVSTNELPQEEVFTVFSNGSSPAIFALKEISLVLHNANGKHIFSNVLNEGDLQNLKSLPAGIYFGTLIHGQNIWSIKLVKSGL